MTQPRQHIYTFAHRVLAQDAHESPSLWNIITGDKAYGYLQMRWAESGAGAEPMTGMLWVEPIRAGGLDIALLRMPDPQAPTEPYFTAFVRPVRGGPLRYFVLERSMDGGAFWAEWKAGGMRIRGANVAEYPADLAARTRLPYPYAATFVDAIVAEAGGAVAAASPAASPVKGFIALGIAIALAVVMYLATRERTPEMPAAHAAVDRTPVVADTPAPDLIPVPPVEPIVIEKPAEKPAEPAPKKKPSKAGTENIEPAVIQKVMRTHVARFRLCYEKQLLAKPGLAGTITATFTIAGDGSTTGISTSGLPEVSACVKSALERIAFPNSSGKPQKVVYPFKFQAS